MSVLVFYLAEHIVCAKVYFVLVANSKFRTARDFHDCPLFVVVLHYAVGVAKVHKRVLVLHDAEILAFLPVVGGSEVPYLRNAVA